MSESDNHMEQTPKKRKSKPKQRLSLSGPRNKKKAKENPGSKKAREDTQGNPNPSLPRKHIKGKEKVK